MNILGHHRIGKRKESEVQPAGPWRFQIEKGVHGPAKMIENWQHFRLKKEEQGNRSMLGREGPIAGRTRKIEVRPNIAGQTRGQKGEGEHVTGTPPYCGAGSLFSKIGYLRDH